jgi:OmpR family response regulator RpaB
VVLYNEKILIIDSEVEIQQALATQLTCIGYNIILTSNGKDAFIEFHREQPDLIILDILLPITDGYSLCKKFRKISPIPIIILTAAANLSDRIMGFEAGADDYIIKPFFQKELEARIKSLLRRTNKNLLKIAKKKQKNLQIHDLVIEMDTRVVSKNNSKIKLTNLEYSLLRLLVSNSGKELSRKTILEEVWGYTPERSIDTRIVDVHISRLRSKIEKKPSNPDLILTVRGKGYMFQQD